MSEFDLRKKSLDILRIELVVWTFKFLGLVERED